MPKTATVTTSEMAILRRVVDPEQPFRSVDAARAILRHALQRFRPRG